MNPKLPIIPEGKILETNTNTNTPQNNFVEPFIPEDEILFKSDGYTFVKYNYNHPYHPGKPNAPCLLVKSESRRNLYFYIGCASGFDPVAHAAKLKAEKAMLESPTPKRSLGDDPSGVKPDQKRRKVGWIDQVDDKRSGEQSKSQ